MQPRATLTAILTAFTLAAVAGCVDDLDAPPDLDDDALGEIGTSAEGLSCTRLTHGPERNTNAAASNGIGAKKVAVILIRFDDNVGTSFDAATARANIFTSATSSNRFLQESSYGELSLRGHLDPAGGDVFGWYTFSAANKDLSAIMPTIRQRAGADGFVDGNYHVVLYATNVGNGGGNAPGGKRADLFGNVTGWVAAHEIGHVLGIDHANAYDCRDAANNRVPISDTCTSVGYGDPFDIQGNSGYRHNSAYYKARMGWFCTSNLSTVNLAVSANTTTRFTLRPLETSTTGLVSVRIPAAAGRGGLTYGWTGNPASVPLFYYLEYRQPTGFDAGLGAAVTSGVSIKLGTDLDTNHMTLMLDNHPATTTMDDAALGVGETFTDRIHGSEGRFTVRVISVSATQAVVDVQVNPVPGIPLVHAEYTGCFSSVPRFIIDWQATPGAAVTSYDVDIKRGAVGAWTNLYNGTATSRVYNGQTNRTDTVRVRACNANGCSDFATDTMRSNCGPAL